MKLSIYRSHALLRLFGGKHTYPVLIEINWWHWMHKVWHGPFYDKSPRNGKPWSILADKSADARWATRSFKHEPMIWGTGGWRKLAVHPPSEGWRLWAYSRWGTLGHIDIFINRRKDVDGNAAA